MNHSVSKIVLPSHEVRHEVRVWGRRDQSGVRRRFKTKDEVQAYLSEVYARESQLKEAASGNPMFQDEFEYWWRTRVIKFAHGWRRNLIQYWDELRMDVSGLTVNEITKEKLKDIELRLLASGVGAKTINQKLGLVMAVLNYSVEQGRIKEHRLKGYKFTRAQKPTIRFWDKETAQAFLSYANEKYSGHHVNRPRWPYVVYLLTLNAGLRAGEVWGLKWNDLLPESRMIFVQRQLELHTLTLKPTKGKETRYVPMPDHVWSELLKLKVSAPVSDLVFHNEGRFIRHRKFATRFDRDLKKFGGQGVTFHGMRHTFATLAISQNIDLKTVSRILGHKDLQTTNNYVHALENGVKHVAEVFSVTPGI